MKHESSTLAVSPASMHGLSPGLIALLLLAALIVWVLGWYGRKMEGGR